MQADHISSNQTSSETPESPVPAEERNNPPKWWLVLLLTILLAGGGGFLGWQWWQSQQQAGEEQQQAGSATGVRVEPVETTTLQESSLFVGTLEAEQTASLRAEADGEIRSVFVRPGDIVGQGEPLAQLDRRSLEASLDQAQANINRAEARLSELRAGPPFRTD